MVPILLSAPRPRPLPPSPVRGPRRHETIPANANDVALAALTTAQADSTVADTAPNVPANPGFALILLSAGRK